MLNVQHRGPDPALLRGPNPPRSLANTGARPSRIRRGWQTLLAIALCTTAFYASAQIRLEAEAYASNSGMQFEPTSDSGGGQNAGWIDAGDFLDFNVNVPATGTYRVDYRVASPNSTGSLVFGESGIDLGPALAIPNTGGWQSWTTASQEVELQAGSRTLTVYANQGGWNFNWFELHEIAPPDTWPRIEAESASTNSGMAFESTSDAGGGENAGWIDAGDFLEFNVNIPTAGTYRVDYRIASPNATGSLTLGEGGTDLGPAVAIPDTGGWQSWTTVSGQVELLAGNHTLMIYANTGGWNLNWFELHHQSDPDVTPPPSGSLPMIRQQGSDWVVNGEPIRLRGLNLGNWLQLEMWMMNEALSTNQGTIHDQCTLEQTLDARFGYNERERLMDIFRDNWMTDRDWDNVAAMGYNVVRLPFPYNLIEDENNPYTLRPDAWEYIDQAIEKAAARGMYTILDLHGAAGSQGWEHHSGCVDRNWYWDGGNGEPASYYQDRTHWLWDMIAQRYQGNGNVAAYGLLNEPWGTDAATLGANLADLYHTVRAVDSEHIILMHGHTSGISEFPTPGPDVAYEMHFYPGLWGWREGEDQTLVHSDWLHCTPAGTEEVCAWEAQMNQRQAPLLVGEFQPWTLLGANGGEMTRKTFDIYNALGWAATAWAYKTVSTGGHSGDASNGWPWGLITNNNASGFGPLNVSDASLGQIENWFAQFSSQTLVTHPDVTYWMEYQPRADGSAIEAEHFRWHSGARMEPTTDPQGGDFNASYLDTGDWMVYRVDVPQSGNYQLQYRVASASGGTVSASIHEGSGLGTTNLPATGGWQNWQTVAGPTVYLDAGERDISLYVTAGGWNINSWRLIPQ